MSQDSGRVTTREFYQALLQTNESIAALGKQVTKVANNQEHFQKTHDGLVETNEKQQDQIDSLRLLDKFWGGINLLGLAVVAWWANR